MTRRTNLPPERTQVLIEQALAFGYSDQWIRDRYHVTTATIDAVRIHLDEVNEHDDDPHRDICANGLHEVTPENTYTRPGDGRTTCGPCRTASNERRSERERVRRAKQREKAA